jgi:hypothetical protein
MTGLLTFLSTLVETKLLIFVTWNSPALVQRILENGELASLFSAAHLCRLLVLRS